MASDFIFAKLQFSKIRTDPGGGHPEASASGQGMNGRS